ncbi:MAG: methylated-DNA--[protein]-cysteine S-methyltransferase [Bacteroidetes bacterium]|nr:methylated-DNA--[protein]-cysteine S-methyltransferase [Bacteroidota bacterium]
MSSPYEKIWQTVLRIPSGKVSTYIQISRIAGLGENARLVGYALHNTPKGLKIPWHRVINSRGTISFPKNSPIHKRQRALLRKEKIVFNKEKIDLKIYEWIPE